MEVLDQRKKGIAEKIKDSDFARMAIGNEFYNTDRSCIKKVNLIEYKPICKVDAITIF